MRNINELSENKSEDVDIKGQIRTLLLLLNYEDQNTVMNDLRNDLRNDRMKEVYFHETRAAEIRRTMDKI